MNTLKHEPPSMSKEACPCDWPTGACTKKLVKKHVHVTGTVAMNTLNHEPPSTSKEACPMNTLKHEPRSLCKACMLGSFTVFKAPLLQSVDVCPRCRLAAGSSAG
eukprot:12894946-Alexandrium_andersonii.AAC.1